MFINYYLTFNESNTYTINHTNDVNPTGEVARGFQGMYDGKDGNVEDGKRDVEYRRGGDDWGSFQRDYGDGLENEGHIQFREEEVVRKT